jgi:hypothetical protein
VLVSDIDFLLRVIGQVVELCLLRRAVIMEFVPLVTNGTFDVVNCVVVVGLGENIALR